jgi:hypothetical protein
MFFMRLTFLDRYGSKISLTLLAILIWLLVSRGYSQDGVLILLFPINWLSFLPWSETIDSYLSPYVNTEWWMWVEMVVAFVVWLFIFFLVRGAYYICSSLEGISLWFVFLVFVSIGFALIYLVLNPALDQMSDWWKNWPGMGEPSYIE